MGSDKFMTESSSFRNVGTVRQLPTYITIWLPLPLLSLIPACSGYDYKQRVCWCEVQHVCRPTHYGMPLWSMFEMCLTTKDEAMSLGLLHEHQVVSYHVDLLFLVVSESSRTFSFQGMKVQQTYTW